jgi:hypothetical protein
MSVIGSNILAGASGQGGGGYNLTRSLRFRSSASASMTRTFGTATSDKKMTISVWVKRAALGTTQSIMCNANSSPGGNEAQFVFRNTDDLRFYTLGGGANPALITTQVFRDVSSWYHLVLSIDTTQATDTNRMKMYVNGVQVTSFSTAVYPSQNADIGFNNAYSHGIGAYTPSSLQFSDAYFAEFYFIDGQGLTPSSFGSTNATTGVWQPARYTGTYGNNGFYLPFTDNSALTSGSNAGLGKDFSGNGNYWNTNNISLTSGSTYDSMLDVPTLTSATAANFPTWNPINNLPTGNPPNTTTITNGNLQVASSAGEGSGNSTAIGTMQVPSTGKWYWEVTITNRATLAASRSQIGIIRQSAYYSASLDVGYATAAGVYAYCGNGEKVASPSGSFSSYGSSWTNGDVIGVACDWDAGTLTFYKNNTSQGTAFSGLSGSDGYYPIAGYFGTFNINFGQRPFAYTPPTGFVALNTFNLPTPTIGATASTQANKYFDVLTWTGNGSNPRSLTGLNFAPDFVWAKNRSVGYTHSLYDSVRGAGANKELVSASTGAEGGENHDQYGYLSSFDSNGFTTTAGSAGQNYYFNDTTYPAYVAWNWKANGTGVTNTAGSITSTVSANTSAGFSVVTYTAQSSGTATMGHGLGVAPAMIIVKSRTVSPSGWNVYHRSLGATKVIYLNSTDAESTSSGNWNNTAPTSTVFTGGTGFANGGNMVAYCFAEVAGYSKFGSYTGNGSSDGTFVYTGFRPKYVIIKNATNVSGGGNWCIKDSVRGTYNANEPNLMANNSDAEYNERAIDFLSNGFKIRDSNGNVNYSGATLIYMAFAENPFKYSLAR